MTSRHRRRDDDGSREISELAALADGSLAPERRDALEERVAASPELADRLAEQERAVARAKSAADEVEAPAALRARIEAQRAFETEHGSPGVVLAGAARLPCSWSRSGLRARFGQLARTFNAALEPDGPRAGGGRRGDADEDSSGWRIALRATGLPRRDAPNFYEAWLRNGSGVLVPIGTFNDGREVTLWAGVSPKELPDSECHPGAGRQRSVLIGQTGARRDGLHGRLARRVRAAFDPVDDLPARAVQAAHHGSLADPQRPGRLLVRQPGDVDGDEHVAEIVGQRGNGGVELGGFDAASGSRACGSATISSWSGSGPGRSRRPSVFSRFKNVLRSARRR